MVSRTSDESDFKMPSSAYGRQVKQLERRGQVLSMRPSMCALCATWDNGTFPIALTVCPTCMDKVIQVAGEVASSWSEVLSIKPCFYCGRRTGFKMYQLNTRICRKCLSKVAKNARTDAKQEKKIRSLQIKRKE